MRRQQWGKTIFTQPHQSPTLHQQPEQAPESLLVYSRRFSCSFKGRLYLAIDAKVGHGVNNAQQRIH